MLETSRTALREVAKTSLLFHLFVEPSTLPSSLRLKTDSVLVFPSDDVGGVQLEALRQSAFQLVARCLSAGSPVVFCLFRPGKRGSEGPMA